MPSVTVKCLTSVTYYYLPFQTLHSVALNYPTLMNTLDKAQKIAKYNRMLELKPMDYYEVNFKFEDKYELPYNVTITEEE